MTTDTEKRAENTQLILNKNPLNLPNLPSDFKSNQQSAYEGINQLFNEQNQQQSTVREARDILGESAKDLTDSEVYDLVNEVQHLVDTWLEEFERNSFDGKTLNELIGINP